MLRHLSGQEKIARYCDPAIKSIVEYDDANSTNLLDTLRTYLETGCSIRDTSEALYLHRNSVIYRLHKIEQLGGLDLDDPNVRFKLRMSYCILRLS